MPENPLKPITVLQIIPSLGAGGAERAVLDVAAALVRFGNRALVMSAGGAMVAALQQSGAAHYLRQVDSKNPLVMWNNAQNLIAFIKEHKVDVVHAHSRAPAWSAFMAARATGIPFVTTYHAAYKGEGRLKRFYNSVMARGDAVIAISHFIAGHIAGTYPEARDRIALIPSGIDLAVYAQAAVTQARKDDFCKACGLRPEVPWIVMPARLSPIKGHRLALQALAMLPPEQRFLCVMIGPDQGRDAYRKQLEAEIKARKLSDKVRLVREADVVAAYALADVVLSPSQVAEGFGRVPVEAQAFGVPVIATALGATRETVLDGETGWLVPAGDAKALAIAVMQALTLTPERREAMAKTAVAHVRGNFDLEKTNAAILALYRKVLPQ